MWCPCLYVLPLCTYVHVYVYAYNIVCMYSIEYPMILYNIRRYYVRVYNDIFLTVNIEWEIWACVECFPERQQRAGERNGWEQGISKERTEGEGKDQKGTYKYVLYPVHVELTARFTWITHAYFGLWIRLKCHQLPLLFPDSAIFTMTF